MTMPNGPLPVVWTVRARRELEAIQAYITAVKPLAAQRLAARLVAAAESLRELPDRFAPPVATTSWLSFGPM